MSPQSQGDKALPPSIDRMVRSDEIAERYDDTFTTQHPLLTYDLKVLARWFDKPGRLLDLGCGTGRVMLDFGRRGFDVTGVDLSRPMLRVARRKLDEAGLAGAKLLEGNLVDLPVDQLSPPYDYAACLGATLGYIQGHENRVRAVRQAASLLRPGGWYVFHVWNFLYNLPTLHLPWIVTGLARWAAGRGEVGDQILWWYRNLYWVYMHTFRLGEIERLVREAGLELVEVDYINKRCDGPLEGDRRREWRSNGFLIRCRRPAEDR
ncbi:MAG: class I SAM-dependent methyltransferase [Planctomycetota bacterium]|nr:class I SAM-dependent methyltransferase [Planctomycetota bacterium]